MSDASPHKSVLRSAMMGLCAGMLITAVVLGVFSLQRSIAPDCSRRSPEECTFELETNRNIGRLQALAAAGFGALGLGLFLSARSRRS